MKTLIIYTSQTGFTKKYAEWLAERTGGDVLELKEAKKVYVDKNTDYSELAHILVERKMGNR